MRPDVLLLAQDCIFKFTNLEQSAYFLFLEPEDGAVDKLFHRYFLRWLLRWLHPPFIVQHRINLRTHVTSHSIVVMLL